MVGFVKNQQRSGAEGAQMFTQWTNIGFINQQAVRDQEPRMGAPWIDAESTFTANTRHVFFVQDFKG